jgi:hypothetical protein
MIQNIENNNNSPYGRVYKIGYMKNGRVVYQVVDGNGKNAGKMSIPLKDCDVFEKSYQDILSTAPKLQEYSQKMTPEKMKKQKRMSRLIIGACTVVGALIPMIKVKGKTWKQIAWTTVGTLAGLGAGFGISLKTTTPSGALKFARATNKISKMDIQPVVE